MSIRRNPARGRYTIIGTDAIEDRRLSFGALGLLCYVLSKPDNWTIRTADVMSRGGIGRGAYTRVMGELEAAGYATLVRTKGEGGRATGSYWDVSEVPTIGTSEVRGNGVSENPTSGKPNSLVSTDLVVMPETAVNDVWHPETGAHNMPGQTATTADPPQLAKPERKARQTKKAEPGMLDAIRAMVDAMEAARGYPVANYARHTRAAKRLVKMDHTPDDVRRTVNYIKRECKHLDGQPVTMETVSKYIGIAAAKPKGRVIPLEELDWLELV